MPELEQDNQEDALITAALLDDGHEDEEDVKARQEILGTDSVKKPTDDEEDDDEEDDDDHSDDDDDEEEDDKSEKTPEKKPTEAQDDTDDDIDDDAEEEDDDEEEKPTQKPTRKQRRQERQRSFLEEVRKDTPQAQRQNVPTYQPIDYSADQEFTPDQLAQDRDAVGTVKFLQGKQLAEAQAQQDQFFKDLQYESALLSKDPKYRFLDDTDKQHFDADKTSEINEMYLQFVGFKLHQSTDENGQPLFYRETGKPVTYATVDRTDISYDKFVRRYVDRMEKWSKSTVEEEVERTRENLSKQRKRQGVRPNGSGKRKSVGNIQLGDISKMSDEEFEANEAEIDRQILNMMG